MIFHRSQDGHEAGPLIILSVTLERMEESYSMRIKAQQSAGGKHRKVSPSQTATGRVALLAIATGAASTAGLGGATAASLQASPAEEAETINFQLANDAELIGEDVSAAPSPQILAISEYKPVAGLDTQLGKAVEASAVRLAEDLAARGPAVVKPAEGAFTSGYGMRWGSLHAGVDIAAPVGTPILAVMDGTVIDSGPASGYGQWIRLLHEDGSISIYGHMETLHVNVGDSVHAGQNIAGMGNRGFSTGPHLHFEIHPNGGGATDPEPWFAQHGIFL